MKIYDHICTCAGGYNFITTATWVTVILRCHQLENVTQFQRY